MSLEQTENVLPIINRAGKRQLMAGNGNRLMEHMRQVPGF